MMRPITCLPFVMIALAGAGSASAEQQLRRCIDPGGRVTLTDQVCPPGHAVLTSTAGPGMPANAALTPLVPDTPEKEVAVAQPGTLPGTLPWRTRVQPAVPAAAALAGDVATMKAARARFLLEREQLPLLAH